MGLGSAFRSRGSMRNFTGASASENLLTEATGETEDDRGTADLEQLDLNEEKAHVLFGAMSQDKTWTNNNELKREE